MKFFSALAIAAAAVSVPAPASALLQKARASIRSSGKPTCPPTNRIADVNGDGWQCCYGMVEKDEAGRDYCDAELGAGLMAALPCNDIKCPVMGCDAPFVLKKLNEGDCCPVCSAPDHLVPLDRHEALENGSPYVEDLASMADVSCFGAKCFRPVCKAGQEVGEVKGKCCRTCV